MEPKRFKGRQLAFYRALINGDLPGSPSSGQRIVRGPLLNRQLNMSRPVKSEHQTPANHIAICTVGLAPIPGLTELDGKTSPAVHGILVDQLLDKCRILCANCSATVCECRFHWSLDSKILDGTQALFILRNNFFPMWSNPDSGKVSVPDQQLQLMNIELAQDGIRFLGPPGESTFR